MKNIKKAIAVILLVGLLMSSLVGCGDSKAPNPEKEDLQKSVEASPETHAEGDHELAGNLYRTGYPIVKDTETYRMVASFDSRQTNFNDMNFFKKLEEQSNIFIDWDLIESQDYGQKKTLILASGNYPDAFFSHLSDTDLNVYVPQDVFIALSDYKEYSPNLNKVFEEHPNYKRVCTYFDDKVYSVGNAAEDPCQYNPDVLYIYKPWLDTLDLEVPTTTEEFYNVLKAFKENDPNGNGKADEIPYSAQGTGGARGFHSFTGAFGPAFYFSSSGSNSFIYEDNGTIKFAADTENFKNFVSYIHTMFNEGLFDQEIFTQDGKQYFAKGKTDEVTLGAFTLWNAENIVGQERADDYIPLSPLKGPEGDQNWTNTLYNNGTIQGNGFAITTQCESPETLVRWLDQFYDKKTSIEAIWGPIEDGPQEMYIFEKFPEGGTFDKYRYENSPVFGPGAVFAEDYDSIVEMPPMMVDKLEIKEKYYDDYLTTNTLPLIRFTEEETNWLSSTGNDIVTYVNDTAARWMMQGGVEEEWDSYLKQLSTMHVDEHLEVLQKAYDRAVGL